MHDHPAESQILPREPSVPGHSKRGRRRARTRGRRRCEPGSSLGQPRWLLAGTRGLLPAAAPGPTLITQAGRWRRRGRGQRAGWCRRGRHRGLGTSERPSKPPRLWQDSLARGYPGQRRGRPRGTGGGKGAGQWDVQARDQRGNVSDVWRKRNDPRATD